MFDIADLHIIPDTQAHSQFTDMKCAIYPSLLETILKLNDLKCGNIMNLSTMVGKKLKFTNMKCLNIINLSTMVAENLGIR